MSRDTSGRATVVACAAVALAITSGAVVAQSVVWELKSTVQRVVEVAPERRAAEADVMARQGEWQQAGLWSNPSVELGASNAMGKEDGQGGTDLNQITLRQPLPLSGRLTHQRHQAQANLKQAHEAVAERSLALEYEGARVGYNSTLPCCS
ncbi:MAG: cobalt-zinc-cadmium resistance protein CzcC [Halothiobacillaceae bacterium]|nr:MAG: cobalt-zinc-cadmium resistance protein CzcC [Halothiobacillaceae bacterium]